MSNPHLSTLLSESTQHVAVETQYGPMRGRRVDNGAVVWLEVPYALPPRRFENPERLPSDFRYEDKEYIYESVYGTQPTNDGQAAGMCFKSSTTTIYIYKVGLGEPTENPLFVNIVSPLSFPSETNLPVKVYIHGGFLQFGSPHGLSSQAQFISAERSEVWVNIGYRLSAFGFLACDEPKVEGNFGFKDQWLALEWVKDNISAFGGNPEDIQVSGLSAGAHSVHQILHHASRLLLGVKAPFTSAVLQSNAIVTSPKTPRELRPQFEAFCRGLELDPYDRDVLTALRDPARVPWKAITKLIDSERLGSHGTFRGCSDGTWMACAPDADAMTWQRMGGLAQGLREHGVRSIVLGDLSEEWYLYSIAHDVTSKQDIEQNLQRYYPEDITAKIMELYLKNVPEDASAEKLTRLFGYMLSEGQVHLPVRLLHRDLVEAGFPVVRYEIRWTPEQGRPKGYVTHATDRPLWTYRLPTLTESQAIIAKAWVRKIADEVKRAESGANDKGTKDVLKLQEDQTIVWGEDTQWDRILEKRKVLPGET
ncbi:carboxylesterase [Amylostereum chailletii]|nr:carboxylesterase [Amylostereum chailletii]